MSEQRTFSAPQWAIVLGVSSGIGAGVALGLAQAGYHIFGVHLDMAERQSEIDSLKKQLEQVGSNHGIQVIFQNTNAASESAQTDLIKQLTDIAGQQSVAVLVHSLAFGSLRPFVKTLDEPDVVLRKQMDMTFTVMAHSLVYWTQAVVDAQLFSPAAKIFALTSAGSSKVTRGYGAVSAAKCALESHVRQLALELAPLNIAVNAIRAGVTDTPAMRKIPGAQKLIEHTKLTNPFHRLTQPSDIAQVIVALLSMPGSWVTGNVIGADGAELYTS